MADLKISALTASTTPLAGTEVLPIVQSSTTVKVSVANLTAGRAVSALSVTATSAATDFTNVDITNTSTGGVAYRLASGGCFGYFDIPTGAFAVRDVTNSATRAYWTTGGNQVLPNGNLVIGTSGKGIDFSATPGTGTSELLADYEEGTWTPSIGGTATYFLQSGTYTKVGRSVLITGSLVVNVIGTGSATTISGLPFASIGSPADFVGFSNFSSLALAVTYMAGSANGSAQIDIRSLLVAGTGVASNNVIGNSTRLDFAGTYSV